jgi:hypothetical protein
MPASSNNTRLVVIAGVLAFVGGCWMGMGSDTAGEPFCVVTPASAAQHPGTAPGQLAAMPAGGCQPGEQQICGRYEGEGDDQKFVSDKCPDD